MTVKEAESLLFAPPRLHNKPLEVVFRSSTALSIREQSEQNKRSQGSAGSGDPTHR